MLAASFFLQNFWKRLLETTFEKAILKNIFQNKKRAGHVPTLILF